MAKQRSKDTYELLFDAASGDIDAYGELFERYSEKLFNFVYYLTYSREEAQDITSDTFIKVFEALQGRDTSSFKIDCYEVVILIDYGAVKTCGEGFLRNGDKMLRLREAPPNKKARYL